VIDLDIRKFFDSVRWDLIVTAVEAHTDAATRWVVLYVKRWLAAPLRLPDGTLQERDRGTPQGSAVSPVLANLFMHYAFDLWLAREFPLVKFERYADDAVIHCVSGYQAQRVLAALHVWMAQVGLELHPDKTRIVYCKDSNRRGSHGHVAFTFLGYTFRPRAAWRKDGRQFTSFLPAISKESPEQDQRRGAVLAAAPLGRQRRAGGSPAGQPESAGLDGLLRGLYPSELYPLLRRINTDLLRWIMNKYKKHRAWKKATRVLAEAAVTRPRYFAHWAWVKPAAR
jgi:hypothetical protein